MPIDEVVTMYEIEFETLRDNCKSQLYINEDGNKMCGKPNGVKVKGWADWRVCRPEICPLIKNPPPKQSLLDFM